MNKAILTIYLFCICYFSASAHTDFFFSHLGVEHGLSQISVIKIFQDSDGYLWFGTRNGVNKYNGYEFNVYRNEINNEKSLSDGNIRSISEDSHKNIWVGTSNGLNCIAHISGEITRYYPQMIDSASSTNAVNHLLNHSNGSLYALSGTTVFICHPDKSVEWSLELSDLDSPIQAIEQSRTNNDIYISTEKALYIYSDTWKLIRKYAAGMPDHPHFPQSRITAFLPDTNGQMWIATDEDGVFLFDKQLNTFTQYDKTNTGLSNNSIRSLIFFNKDSILIGTFGGPNILNKKDNTIEPVNMNIEGQGGLNHYSVHSMLVDKDETLWIGTYSAGINYYSPYYKAITFISSYEYAGIMGKGLEDKYGHMWFATEGAGLLYYNPRTNQQQLYPLRPLGIGNYEANIIKSIAIDEDDIYCSTHFGSVYRFSITKRTYELFYDSKIYDIYTLFIDSKKRLWIPTFNDNHLVMIQDGTAVNTFKANEQIMRFERITAIHEWKPDVFLFASSTDSIYLYDLNRETVTNIAHRIPRNPNERLGTITSIVQDASHIWISTTKMGIFRFDHELNFQKQYRSDDGISNSYISSMIKDNNNDIWVATNYELLQWNKNDDRFYPIKPVESPMQEFSLFAGSVASDGTIYFPGSKGALAFNPKNLKNNPTIPPIYITSLITNNHEDIIAKMRINDTNETYPRNYSITLNANQNNIIIRYAALNYIHPEGNKYMYRLDGADNMWHNVGNRMEAYYANLPSGKYTFHLKASNNDGVWNPDETILQIVVKPPVYKSWWAYTIYLIIALVIIILIINHQHRKHELERDIRFRQMEQEKQKELHEERMRMFANFSHELKTPLTLILNPLEDLVQKVSFSPEVKQALGMIKKNTGKMLSLVNNLMDIQKYEAGKRVLNKKQVNFSIFLESIFQSFEYMAKKRKLHLRIENELAPDYIVFFDETEIEKVFFNLLSNAFKFTPADGCVTIHVKPTLFQGNNYISIRVIDTGKGFSQEEAKKIFEPFYRFGEDIHYQMSGTGIGLSLARSIVSLHNGYIWAESDRESGATFTILLPDTEVQTATVQPPVQITETSQKAHLLVEEQENKGKKIVLFVDDDNEIVQYIEQQLTPEYLVLKASNGKEALAVIKDKTPHLIISDIMMPVMNGIELCRHIKENKNLYDIPVILLTGSSKDTKIKEGFDAGADDYIAKPFDTELLKTRIRNLLTNREKIKSAHTEMVSLKNLGIDIPLKENEFLSKYIEIVKANISNQDLDISGIYEELGMSRANFYRKVKSITGMSPVDLIRNIRLDAGAKLLIESDLNISEIAQHVGFASRSYFARSFKNIYGLSPSEYQQKNRS